MANSAPPDFVVAGHVTRDLVAGVERPGGTASYAAVVAAELGLRVAIITSAPEDFPIASERPGVGVYRQPAATPTVMEHRWIGRYRDQYLRSRAATLDVASLPEAVLHAPVVLFGPVVQEVDLSLLGAFHQALRGATLQGWLRRAGADGHIEAIDAESWDAEPLLRSVDAAFLSDEDLGLLGAEASTRREALLDRWARLVRILAVTNGDAGVSIALDGRWHDLGVMPVHELDGTGAGDAFAAAFLIRYHETADAGEAARFATAAASFVVEAPGIVGAPTRRAVLARMAAFPEVRLRAR